MLGTPSHRYTILKTPANNYELFLENLVHYLLPLCYKHLQKAVAGTLLETHYEYTRKLILSCQKWSLTRLENLITVNNIHQPAKNKNVPYRLSTFVENWKHSRRKAVKKNSSFIKDLIGYTISGEPRRLRERGNKPTCISQWRNSRRGYSATYPVAALYSIVYTPPLRWVVDRVQPSFDVKLFSTGTDLSSTHSSIHVYFYTLSSCMVYLLVVYLTAPFYKYHSWIDVLSTNFTQNCEEREVKQL